VAILLLIIAIALVVSFGLIVFVGAPYVPSLKPHIEAAFELLDLQEGDLLLELGAGDGRVMVAALERGQRVIGYELNPVLAAVAWLRTRKYGTRAKVVWGDAFQAEWPPETKGVYLFGVKRLAQRVDRRLMGDSTGAKFVTVGFEVMGKQADATRGAVHLYTY